MRYDSGDRFTRVLTVSIPFGGRGAGAECVDYCPTGVPTANEKPRRPIETRAAFSKFSSAD